MSLIHTETESFLQHRFPKTELLLCALANLLQGLSLNLYLHLPGFLKSLGAGEAEIGAIFSLMAVAAILVRPLLGQGIDRWGRRVMILGGGLANVIVLTMYLTIREMGPWVYLVRIGHGMTETTLFTAFFTYAADLVPAERRTEGIALFGVSGLVSISGGALLGDWVLARAGYRGVFTSSVALAICSLVLSLPLRERQPPVVKRTSRGFFGALRQEDLQPVWFIGAAFATASAPYFTFLKTLVMHLQAGSVGGFFTAFTGGALILRLFFTWVPDRVGKKRVLLPGLGLVAGGLVVLAFSTQNMDILIAGFLCGLGHGFAFPILISFVIERAPAAERGVAVSIFTALFDASILLGGPSFGAVIQYSGYEAMFVCAAALLVGAALAFVWWDAHAVGRLVRLPPGTPPA